MIFKQKLIKDPLSRFDHLVPVQSVLINLASQEGCDEEPYDQMMDAVEHIEHLEAEVSRLEEELEKYKEENQAMCEELQLLHDEKENW